MGYEISNKELEALQKLLDSVKKKKIKDIEDIGDEGLKELESAIRKNEIQRKLISRKAEAQLTGALIESKKQGR